MEIDAFQHPWFSEEKHHLYRAVDAGSGFVLSEHLEKDWTSMGYLILLKKLLKKWKKLLLIVADNRKTFWIGEENKLDIEIFTSSGPTSKPNVKRP